MADAYVVDTGVFLRWFVDQDGFEYARELQQGLVDGSMTVATADFARVEVAGVLRKKGLLAGRLTAGEFAAAVRVIDDIGVTIYETSADRLERAASLAARKMLGMYDALFVHLAQELELPLLTSDAKLCWGDVQSGGGGAGVQAAVPDGDDQARVADGQGAGQVDGVGAA